MTEVLSEPKKLNIKTSCKDCVFADIYDGVQLCAMDRLKIFIERGEAKENPSLYYTINRLCNTCRNEDTIKQLYPKLPIDQVRDKVRESVIPTVDFIILVTKDNVKRINDTFRSIKAMEILPRKIIFGVVGDGVDVKSVYRMTRNLTELVKDVVVVSLFKKNPTELEVIDESMIKCHSFFVSLFECGYFIQPDFINQIDEIVNTNLIQLPMITNSDKTINATTICKAIFNYTGTYDGLLEAIRQQLKDDGKEEIVWNQK